MLDPFIQGDEVLNTEEQFQQKKMYHKMSLHSILNDDETNFFWISNEFRKQKRQVESHTEEPIVKRRRSSFDCPLLDTVEHLYGAKRDEEAITALNILCETKNNLNEKANPTTPPSRTPTTPSPPCGSPTLSVPPSPPKISDFFSNQWMQRFTELKAFSKQYGHTNVTRTTEAYKSLGNWVAEQRRKHRKGKMPTEQFDLLSSIGFEWDRKYYFQPGHSK